MVETAGRVLKANQVKLRGQRRLEIGQPSPSPAPGFRAALASPQVRIVENNDRYAVMEITCSCGTKTHVRCDYAMKTD